jgi:hypothetical protein
MLTNDGDHGLSDECSAESAFFHNHPIHSTRGRRSSSSCQRRSTIRGVRTRRCPKCRD